MVLSPSQHAPPLTCLLQPAFDDSARICHALLRHAQVEKGACSKEFGALQACFKQAVSVHACCSLTPVQHDAGMQPRALSLPRVAVQQACRG
jgi:hypothetical protein